MIDRRFITFCAIGGGNTLIHMGIAWLAVRYAQFTPLAANLVAFLGANCCSFAANARLTFSMAPDWRRYPGFLAVSLTGLAVSSTLVWLAGRFHIHYLLAIAAASVLSAIISFGLSARLVFAARKH